MNKYTLIGEIKSFNLTMYNNSSHRNLLNIVNLQMKYNFFFYLRKDNTSCFLLLKYKLKLLLKQNSKNQR